MKNDLLRGAPAIGDHLGVSNIRKVYHMLETRQLPGFKIGSIWHMRKSTLAAHITKLEEETKRS